MTKVAIIAIAAAIGSAGVAFAEPVTTSYVTAQDFIQQEANAHRATAPQAHGDFDRASAGQHYANEFLNVTR